MPELLVAIKNVGWPNVKADEERFPVFWCGNGRKMCCNAAAGMCRTIFTSLAAIAFEDLDIFQYTVPLTRKKVPEYNFTRKSSYDCTFAYQRY